MLLLRRKHFVVAHGEFGVRENVELKFRRGMARPVARSAYNLGGPLPTWSPESFPPGITGAGPVYPAKNAYSTPHPRVVCERSFEEM